MKKSLLVIVLLCLLVAVSYVQMKRSDSREANIYEEGKNSNIAIIADYQSQNDSINESLEQEIESTKKSLSASQLEMANLNDSMQGVIQTKDSTISSIKNDNIKLLSTAKTRSKLSNAKRSSSKSNYHEILAHYKKKVDRLPEDLSTYERRVAIDEIRGETVGKFSISMVKFDRIRKENKINY